MVRGHLWVSALRGHAVAGHARGGAGGAIVNVSAAAATLGSAHEYVDHATAKTGIDAMTVGLAEGLADRGVRVNAVAPGMVDTRTRADAGDPGRARRIAGRVTMGWVGRPNECGAVVGAGDVVAQAERVTANLTTALADAGACLSEVVRTTVHVASTDQRDLVTAWQVVHDAFAPHDPPSTLFGVTVLSHPGQLVEVDAIATLPG